MANSFNTSPTPPPVPPIAESTPAPRATRKGCFSLWTLLAVVIFIAAAVIGLNARKVYNVGIEYLASRAAVKVEQAMEAGDQVGASELAGEMYRKYPNSSAILRVTAKFLTEISQDHVNAVAMLKRLIATGKGTQDDQLLLAQTQVKAGDVVAAAAALKALPEALQNGRKGLEAKSLIAAMTGNRAEAETLLRQALNCEPNDPECKLKLAILDEAQAFQSGPRNNISDRIWEVARRGDKTALTAIRHLADSSTTTSANVDELLALITAHPQATDSIRYAVLRTHHRLRPLDTKALVEKEITRQRGKSAQEIPDFFRWLVAVGYQHRIEEILPVELALKDAKSLLIYIDALSANGEWQALSDLMQRQKLPISAATKSLVLGQSHGQLQSRNPQIAGQFLREAMDAAGPNDRVILDRVAQSAESLGLTDLAKDAYRKMLLQRPEGRVELLEKIMNLCRQDRDVKGMIDTLKELHQLRPGFQGYADQLDYLRLVSGIEMELAANVVWTADREPATLTQGYPRALMTAMTERRFGREQEWRVAASAVPDPNKLSPGLRAVMTGYYAQLGEREKAFRLGETLVGTLVNGVLTGDKRGLLLDEELRLLETGMR